MRIALHPEASTDIYEAACWYDDQVPGLGDEFVEFIARWLEVLRESANVWPPWPNAPVVIPPIRRLVMDRFPYAIGYRVYPDRVLVLAISHMSRRPFYWRSRVGG